MGIVDRFRRALKVFRGYDAALDQRSSTWAPSGNSATTEVGIAAATIARRARDAVRNDPYASRIVDLWTGNAVGDGIKTSWPDEMHSHVWSRWSASAECDAEGHLNFAGIQALVMRAVVESGECFVRFRVVQPSPANPIGLQLQVMESDYLDTSRNGMVDGAPTVQGIVLGEAGRPTGYWMYRAHPGGWMLPGVGMTSEFIPASEVLHVYRKRRPGQLRDVSWLAPVLLRLRDLGDYETALLMKAKIEACLAAVVTEEGDDTLTGQAASLLRDAHGRAVESFEPGMILYRRGAGSVDVVNPSGGGAHQEFARRALEATAVGAGLTYDQVSGDLTQANYSSLRAGKIEFRRLCEQVQYGMLIPMLVQRVADRFHAQGALLGLWDAAMPEGVSHVPPTHEMIDPLKDTTALIMQVRAGYVSWADAVASFGYDFREMIASIRQINALLDDAGISLDTDPRRVTKSGAAQDPSQMAAIEIAATSAASDEIAARRP
jgi:lambda family phage portal protein